MDIKKTADLGEKEENTIIIHLLNRRGGRLFANLKNEKKRKRREMGSRGSLIEKRKKSLALPLVGGAWRSQATCSRGEKGRESAGPPDGKKEKSGGGGGGKPPPVKRKRGNLSLTQPFQDKRGKEGLRRDYSQIYRPPHYTHTEDPMDFG